MTLVENLSRLYANFTQIPLDVLLNKKFVAAKMTVTEYQTSMQTTQAFFVKINLSFSYDRSKNITYILDLIYRLHLEQKVEIVVIDHLQITKVTNNFDNDRLAIDEIMTKLKQLAIELNLLIIILSQFSRDSYNTHQGKASQITALKGSGGIETNSDLVLIMSEFQPFILPKKEMEKPLQLYDQTATKLYEHGRTQPLAKIIELSIKKNRSGRRRNLLYHFNMTTQTFREIGYVEPYVAV